MIEENKNVAIVSGASRGLGYQIALLLAKKGMHVIGLSRTIGGLEELADEIAENNGTSTMVPIDLKMESEIDTLGILVNDRWGGIKTFIHAASVATPMSPVTNLLLNDYDLAVRVNARATLKLIQVFDPLLKKIDGSMFVLIDDLIRGKFLASYSASKMACRAVVDAYMQENKRIGPEVRVFTPLPMPTALRARFFPGEDKTKLASCFSQAKLLTEQIN